MFGQRLVNTRSLFDAHIDKGNVFRSEFFGAAVADAASIEVRITTGTKEVVSEFFAQAGGAGRAFLYEGTTFTAPGAALAGSNLRRSDTTSALLATMETAPTVNVVGNLLGSSLVPGDSKKAGFGGSTQGDEALILKPSTEYLLRLTNGSGGVADLLLSILCYEL